MKARYRLAWTTDVGFAGMDDRSFESLEAAQAAATSGVTWQPWERDSWKSTRDQYGDVFTVFRSYR